MGTVKPTLRQLFAGFPQRSHAGDLAFCSIPGELHDSLGKDLREASPYKMTFLCGYSNGMNGYIPAEFAFANGGYEVGQTHYAKGTGEALGWKFVGCIS